MKKKTEQKLCRDCKHHIQKPGNAWILLCVHPKVNARNPLALSGSKPDGIHALDERINTRTLFGRAQCGMRGALWEPITGAGA